MSYILDALKKAESERKLGSVPNVYMDPLPMARSEEPVAGLRKAWWWIAAALLALSGVAAVWIKSTQQPAVVSSPIVATQAAVSPSVAEESVKAAPVQRDAQLKPPIVKKVERPPSTPAVKKAAVAVQEKTKKSVTPTSQGSKNLPVTASAQAEAEKRAEKPVPARATAMQAPAPEPSVMETSVAMLRDLPEHIQRGIPQISVGGYIYSAKPAERSLLLNNRLVREGERTPSGLTLEKMMAKEAILSYQGQRFRLPYQSY